MKRKGAGGKQQKTAKKAKADGGKFAGAMIQKKLLEMKTYDNNISSTFTNAGGFTCLNDPVVGASFFQRIGNKMFMKSVQVHFQLQPGSTAVTDVVRVMLIYDKQTNASFPTLASILGDANAGAGTDVQSFKNIANVDRFKVLRDWYITTPAVTVVATAVTQLGPADYINQALQVNEFVNLRGLETLYNQNNSGTVADITTGSLLLLTLSSTASTGTWNCVGRTRVRYSD